MMDDGFPPMGEGEEILVEFIPRDERQYMRQKNNVVLLTTKSLYYLKSRFVGTPPWEFISIPLEEIRTFRSLRRRALHGFVFGPLLMCLSLVFFAALLDGKPKGRGAAGTCLMLAGASAFGGYSLLFGTRRRVIEFECEDRKYKYKSQPLQYTEATEHAEEAERVLRDPASHGIPPDLIASIQFLD